MEAITEKHVHHVEIKAWADGADIQYFSEIEEKWRDVRDHDPLWGVNCKYRVKPKYEEGWYLVKSKLTGAELVRYYSEDRLYEMVGIKELRIEYVEIIRKLR